MESSSIRVMSLLQLVMLVAAQTAPAPTKSETPIGSPILIPTPPIASPMPSPIGSPVLTPTPPIASPALSSIGSPILLPVSPLALSEKIDTHCHYVPPFYKALLDSRNFTATGTPFPSWNASAHLAVNAQLGIVTSVVSVSTPGAKLFVDDPIEEGRTIARQINEYGYGLTLEYPKKFLYWATLTLPDLEGAVAEAIHALDNLGAAGVIIEASAFGELLGTPRWAPLYEVLNDRNAVVFVHPSNSPCAEAPIFLPNSTDLPPFVVDFLLDTTRAAVNLVYRNVTTQYPNITFILAHSGGFLPFAATRAVQGLALLSANPADYIALLRNFHIDLAISATPFSLPSTTKFFNDTQITYGSDYPFYPTPAIQQNTGYLLSFGFSRAALRKIDYSNAFQIFKKFLTPRPSSLVNCDVVPSV